MEPDASLQRAQENTTCPLPKHDQFSLRSPSYLLNITFNIILPSAASYFELFLYLIFPHQIPVHTAPFPTFHMPFFPILLDLIARVILGEENQSLSSTTSNFLQSPVTSSLLGPATCHKNTLSLHTSLNVRDQVSYPFL